MAGFSLLSSGLSGSSFTAFFSDLPPIFQQAITSKSIPSSKYSKRVRRDAPIHSPTAPPISAKNWLFCKKI